MNDPGDDSRLDARLADMLAVTDATLGRLDVDDLLAELLHRAVEVLNADTAAVLLLDQSSNQLVARAAHGIEAEVRQGVRVPVGEGFAGRVAATKRPILLDRVDATTVWNPILWNTGIKVMLGVPLLSAGNVIGVLHVGRLRDQPFDAHDTHVLETVAERLTGALQARDLDVERAATRAVQRSLHPSALPACEGLTFGARYVPAEDLGVGGDWYDVFELPNGEVWIVVGDVAGHGLRAGLVMSRLRSTIRAYALENHSPDQVLSLADRKLQHFEPDQMATVLCATLNPPFDTIHIASAGHPPPLIASPTTETEFITTSEEPPLGVPGSPDRSTITTALPVDGVFLAYSDGLIERRDEDLDIGLERLHSAVKADIPERVCQTVMSALVGNTIPTDDIALIVAHRGSRTPWKRRWVTSN